MVSYSLLVGLGDLAEAGRLAGVGPVAPGQGAALAGVRVAGVAAAAGRPGTAAAATAREERPGTGDTQAGQCGRTDEAPARDSASQCVLDFSHAFLLECRLWGSRWPERFLSATDPARVATGCQRMVSTNLILIQSHAADHDIHW